jgi:hypothetical protein
MNLGHRVPKGVLVGLAGFEPTTSCTPSKRASQAAPQPDLSSVHARQERLPEE